MFVDTLNEYYADFYARMDKPYDDWRAYSYEEQKALDSINRAARCSRRSWAAVAVLGGHLPADPRERPRASKDVLILGGIAAIRAGFEDGKETGIHKAGAQRARGLVRGRGHPAAGGRGRQGGPAHRLGGGPVHQVARAAAADRATTDAPLPGRHQPAPDGAGRGRAALSGAAAR